MRRPCSLLQRRRRHPGRSDDPEYLHEQQQQPGDHFNKLLHGTSMEFYITVGLNAIIQHSMALVGEMSLLRKNEMLMQL